MEILIWKYSSKHSISYQRELKNYLKVVLCAAYLYYCSTLYVRSMVVEKIAAKKKDL